MRAPRIAAGLLALTAGLALSLPAQAAATITIVNNDGAGEGFNDPTAVLPIGNNPGATLGQQRLNAFNFVASLWGARITSTQTILVRAQFDPQTCGASGAVLGSAGTVTIHRDFAGAPFASTWYHAALANKLTASDLDPTNPDINATFNSAIDTACLPGTVGWYYGLDGLAPANTIDIVPVLLHEIAHGLGFSNFVNEATGANNGGFTDAYSHFTFDNTTAKHWNVMTDPERVASAINVRNVVWDGPQVTAAATFLSFGTPELVINGGSLAGTYPIGPAAFGPTYTSGGLTGNVVLGVDGVAPANDACEALTNGAAINGNICLVDRGTCAFTIKVKNCQNAGAIAALVADNAAGSPPAGLGGADATITIPSGRITLALGNSIKALLPAPGVNVTIRNDVSQRAGADGAGRLLLNAVDPVALGSSISHWDPITFPNTLMEPAINVGLPYDVDLTAPQLRDIGWGPVTPVELQGFGIE